MAFPAVDCDAVDGSWSSAAAEAKDGRIVVDLNCVLAINAARTLGFTNSGNVDTVGGEMKLEEVSEEFEMIGPCCAKAEPNPQPCGAKPRLSLLIMSAA